MLPAQQLISVKKLVKSCHSGAFSCQRLNISLWSWSIAKQSYKKRDIHHVDTSMALNHRKCCYLYARCVKGLVFANKLAMQVINYYCFNNKQQPPGLKSEASAKNCSSSNDHLRLQNN